MCLSPLLEHDAGSSVVRIATPYRGSSDRRAVLYNAICVCMWTDGRTQHSYDTLSLFCEKRVNHQVQLYSVPKFGLRIEKGDEAVKRYGIFSVQILTTGFIVQGFWLFSVSPAKYLECIIIGYGQVIPSRHA